MNLLDLPRIPASRWQLAAEKEALSAVAGETKRKVRLTTALPTACLVLGRTLRDVAGRAGAKRVGMDGSTGEQIA